MLTFSKNATPGRTVVGQRERPHKSPGPVSWVIEVDPDVWAVDSLRPADPERTVIRETIDSWTEPPEAIMAMSAGRPRFEYHMANGIIVVFVTEENGQGGGWLLVQHVHLRNWFRT